ncbi:MAG TPA: glutathione S-transferase family protein [Candidatus Cybelea sp.]|nr:glutathione S-transferase family protein [Candidatus Cybelea sp.]
MSKLKIYGVPFSRAHRALWMANELGLEFENIPTHFADGSAKTAEYLAINPNGKLPAIDDNGFKLWESMAINCYLAKKHGKGLWPSTPEGEAQVLQWSFWVMTELEKSLLAALLNRVAYPEAQRDKKAADEGEKAAQAPLKVLDQALAKTGYLIGSNFTAADLNVAAVLSWGKMARIDLKPYPNVAKWLDACQARPSFIKSQPKRG